MVRHLKELNHLLEKYNLSKNDVFVVGGGVLAVKGIRVNNDLDFSFVNIKNIESGPFLKRGKKYIKVSKNIDCFFDRYSDLGIYDKDIAGKEYYFFAEGYKFVLPEIEIAYKIITGKINDGQYISKIDEYILQAKEWNWDIFGQALMYVFNNENKKRYFSKHKMISLIIKGLRNPNRALRYIYNRILFYFPNTTTVFARPNKKLNSQLIIKIPTAALFCNHFINGEFSRYDLLMRYIAIDFILNNDEVGLEYYKTMQKKRVEGETLEDFKKLIDSVKEKGFLNKNPIPISKDGHIVDGSHRLACALYFNVKEIPIEIKPIRGVYYSKQWFIDNGFDDEAIQLLEKTKRYLFLEKGIYFPVIIWPPAKDYFRAIAEDIKPRYKTVFEKELTVGDFNSFTEKIYESDDIAKWKVGLKKNLMKGYEPRIYFMLLEVPHPSFRPKPRFNSYLSKEMEDLKNEMRNKYKNYIDNYFSDIIMHIGDNFEHNQKIIEIIRNYIDLNESDIEENR